MEEVHVFSKKLTPAFSALYRVFTDAQRELGNLESLNIEEKHRSIPSKNGGVTNPSETSRSEKGNNNHVEKISRQETMNKQALIERIEEIRRNSQTPKYLEVQQKLETKEK